MNAIRTSLALAALAGGFQQEAEAETSTASGAAQQEEAKPAVNGKEFTYFFKTEFEKDDAGNKIGEGKKHPDVKAVLPVPKLEDLLAGIGENEKIRNFVMDVVGDAIYLAGRSQINDWREANPGKTFTTTDFDLSKLTLEAVASMPKGQRGAWAPGDEEHKEFAELYTAVMAHKVNYEPKKIKVHLDHFKKGFSAIKTNKPVIKKLQEFLTLFAAHVEEEELEEVKQTFDWLSARADKYLKAEEKNLLEAL